MVLRPFRKSDKPVAFQTQNKRHHKTKPDLGIQIHLQKNTVASSRTGCSGVMKPVRRNCDSTEPPVQVPCFPARSKHPAGRSHTATPVQSSVHCGLSRDSPSSPTHNIRTTTLMVQTKCCRQCPEQAQADGDASSKTQTAEAPKASVRFAPLEEGLHGVRFCKDLTGNQGAASSRASTRDLHITWRVSLSAKTNSSSDVSAARRPNTTWTRTDNAPRRLVLDHYAKLMDPTRGSYFERTSLAGIVTDIATGRGLRHVHPCCHLYIQR